MQGTKLEPVARVIPRVVEVSGHVLYELLFNDLDVGHIQKKQLQKYETTLAVSYMEIYKDEVYDLFVTRENVRGLL
jgi:kinesin family protein 22